MQTPTPNSFCQFGGGGGRGDKPLSSKCTALTAVPMYIYDQPRALIGRVVCIKIKNIQSSSRPYPFNIERRE
jgi:hypothetical protein